MLNGEPVAQGKLEEFRGYADTVYQPGELTAVTFRGDTETGRTALHSAKGSVAMTLVPDRTEIAADDSDLCYVEINMTAANGVINNTVNPKVAVQVSGAGILLGLGSSEPKSLERYRAGAFTARDGRLLAVIRPTGSGKIQITATAEGFAPAAAEITAV